MRYRLRKSEEELATLYRLKLGILYLGLESGDEEILRRVERLLATLDRALVHLARGESVLRPEYLRAL